MTLRGWINEKEWNKYTSDWAIKQLLSQMNSHDWNGWPTANVIVWGEWSGTHVAAQIEHVCIIQTEFNLTIWLGNN
jgi:hypothetical protein